MGTLTRRCRSVRIQVKDARQVKAPPAIVSSARCQRSELFRTYGLAAFRAVPCVRTVFRLVVRCCVRAWGGEGDGTDVGGRGREGCHKFAHAYSELRNRESRVSSGLAGGRIPATRAPVKFSFTLGGRRFLSLVGGPDEGPVLAPLGCPGEIAPSFKLSDYQCPPSNVGG